MLKQNNCINFSLANPAYIKANGKVQKQILSQLLCNRPTFFVVISTGYREVASRPVIGLLSVSTMQIKALNCNLEGTSLSCIP